MVAVNFIKYFLAGLFFTILLVFAVSVLAADAVSTTAPTATQAEKKAEINRLLRDPETRRQLIDQLAEALNQQQAQAEPQPPPPAPANTTVKVLENLSSSIQAIHFGVAEIIAEAHRTEEIYSQFLHHLMNVDARRAWIILLLKCMGIIGLSYLAFFYTRHVTHKISDWLSTFTAKWFSVKIFNLLFSWLLSLLPVAVFAITSYLTLILLGISETMQWVLLGWISAFLIVKTLEVIYELVFGLAALFPKLLEMPGNLISFLKKCLFRLTALIVYGYFVVQVALYLGALPGIYQILLKFWGFLIVITLITFILKLPLRVVKIMESRKGRTDQQSLRLERIARIELTVRAASIIYLLLLYLVWIVRENNFFWFVVKGTFFSLVLLFLSIKVSQLIHIYLSREIRVSKSLKKRLPGLEQRIRRYRRMLDLIFRAIIYVALTMIIIKIWSGQEVVWVSPALKEVLLIKIISILCIGIAAMLIWELSNSLIEFSLSKSGEDLTIESGRAHTLLTVARKTIFISLSLIAFLMILSEFGMNIGPLLAGAGVLGLAISFGAQKLMQDLITGFFMLLENQIAVGDVVRIGDKAGTVEIISIRTVRLRDTEGIVHIIPYSSIVTVSNLTKDFSCYLFEIGVAYRENVDEVVKVLSQIALNLQRDPEYALMILEPLEILGLDKFADSAIIIKARFKTRPSMQWRVGREFNRRMKQKFDELDIQIPFPHTVIFFGENKGGGAYPAHLQVKLET